MAIIFQLFIAPINYSYAEDDFFSWKTVESALPFVTNATNAFMSNYFQAMNQNQTASQYDVYKGRFDAQLKLQPIQPQNVKGGALFNGCFVLPAQINKLPSNQMCSAQNGQAIQGGYASALIDTMEYNLAQIEKFEVKGNDEFNQQGVGCYDKKIEDFETLLKKRNREIDAYKQRLKALLDEFKTLANDDLKNIKKLTAILDGGPNGEEHLQDIKFDNVFLGKSDPANVCGSIISRGKISQLGKQAKGGGLKGIENFLLAQSDEASTFLGKTKNIKNDVEKLSKALAKNMQDRSDSSADLSDVAFSGNTLNKNNKAIENVISNFNQELKNKFDNLESKLKVESTLEGNPILINKMQLIKAGKINMNELEEQLVNFEEMSKKDCLQKQVNSNFGSIQSFVKRLENIHVSKESNRDADNPLANSIISLFESEKNIDNLVGQVGQIENQDRGILSHYVLKTNKTILVGTMKIGASTPMRPSQILANFAYACNNNFKASFPGNSSNYSQAEAVKAVKDFAAQRENIRKVASSDLATRINNQLLECPSDQSTGKEINSCTSDSTNTNSPKFCLRTAQTCASNIIGCLEKAKEKTQKYTNLRKTYIDNYQKNVTDLKAKLAKELRSFNNYVGFQGQSLDATLGLGTVFGVPQIEFNFSVIEKMGLEKGVNPNLALEDPDKYLEKMLQNIDAIQEKTDRQQDELMTKLSEVKNQFIGNFKANKQYLNIVIQDCQKAISQTSEGLKKQNEQISENNKKTQMACQKLKAFNEDPESIEHEQLADDLSEVIQLAASVPQSGQFVQKNSGYDQSQIARIRSFNLKCEEDSKSTNKFLPTSNGGLTVSNICSTKNKKLVNALLPNANVNELCDQKQTGKETCSENDYIEQLNKHLKEGIVLCFSTKNPNKLLSYKNNDIPDECKKNGKDGAKIDEPNKALNEKEDYLKYSSAISEKLSICTPAKEGSSSDLQQLASAYNCLKAKQAAGEVAVSFCNYSNNNEVNEKDSAFQSLFGAIGKGLGTTRN